MRRHSRPLYLLAIALRIPPATATALYAYRDRYSIGLDSTLDDYGVRFHVSKHLDDRGTSESLFSFRHVRALSSLVDRWRSYRQNSRKI